MYALKAARIKKNCIVILDLFVDFLNVGFNKLDMGSKTVLGGNMYCSIYKSTKKAMTYLYLNNKDDFKDVPESLLKNFGAPMFIMTVDLNKRDKLAYASLENVKKALMNNGYYLQLPPALSGELQHIRDKNTKL